MICRKFSLCFTIILSLSLSCFNLLPSQNDTLHFLGNKNYPPFSFIDENGNPAGFAVDLIHEVAAESNLNINLELKNWHHAYQGLLYKSADGIIAMSRSKEREPDFAFTIPHSFLSHVMIARPFVTAETLDEIKTLNVLVQRNDVMHHHLLKNVLADSIILADTFDELFTLFNAGVGDVLIVSKIHAYYFYEKYFLKNYQIITLPINPMPLCFAVQHDNELLLAKLNEGLYVLQTSGRIDELFQKWFTVEMSETMPEFLSAWWKYLSIILVLLAFGFIAWNRGLRRQVERQTERLKRELNAKTQTEKQLQTVVQRLTIAQKSAGIGIWELDLLNYDLYWDDGMFALYEKDKDKVKANYEGWIASLHPDFKEAALKEFEDCIKNKRDFASTFKISISSKKQKYIRAFAKIIYNKKNIATKAVGVNWDVSKRKAEEKVNDVIYSISQAAVFSENLVGFMEKIRFELSRVVDTTNFFIGLLEEETGSLYLPFMKDNVEEFKYFPIKNSISSYVISQKKSLLFYAEDLEELNKQGVIQRAGGKAEVWLGVPLRIENQIIGLIVLQSYTNRNAITLEHARILEHIAPQLSLSIKRKKIQDELIQSEETLRKTAAQLKEAQIIARIGNFEWNEDTRQFSFSDEIYQIFGIVRKNENPDFEEFKKLVHSGDSHNLFTLLEEAATQKKPFETECRIFNRETGEPRIIIIKGKPVLRNEKQTGIFSGILQDITEQKEIEYELKAAKENAEQSDKLKSAFLANMSHEIRTPMNSILGFSQILTEAESPEELEKYTEIINSNGEHLLRLIDEIIDISKVEAGLMKVDKESFYLEALAENTLCQFAENYKVKENQVNLLLHPPKNRIGMISADQTKLRQVLINLIYNALKFTNKGHVALDFEIRNETSICFKISDTGIGIPQDKQTDIFDRFMQINTNEVSKTTGAGLGLALCKSYVKLMGGEIWVESELDIGSAFYFTIPFQRAESDFSEVDLQSKIKFEVHKIHTILVAEDDKDSFLYIRAALRKLNFEILHAENGLDAVELCRKNQNIDLVLMDIRMPEMNGLIATQKIKNFRKDLPIIAQTAYAMDGDREKALEAGCDDYISKPVKRAVLLEKLKTYLLNKV